MTQLDPQPNSQPPNYSGSNIYCSSGSCSCLFEDVNVKFKEWNEIFLSNLKKKNVCLPGF